MKVPSNTYLPTPPPPHKFGKGCFLRIYYHFTKVRSLCFDLLFHFPWHYIWDYLILFLLFAWYSILCRYHN